MMAEIYHNNAYRASASPRALRVRAVGPSGSVRDVSRNRNGDWMAFEY
jgi:hypothetical protein